MTHSKLPSLAMSDVRALYNYHYCSPQTKFITPPPPTQTLEITSVYQFPTHSIARGQERIRSMKFKIRELS